MTINLKKLVLSLCASQQVDIYRAVTLGSPRHSLFAPSAPARHSVHNATGDDKAGARFVMTGRGYCSVVWIWSNSISADTCDC